MVNTHMLIRQITESTSGEDPNSWSNRDLGSVLDYINLQNAALGRDYDLSRDDPIVILGLVGDPKLGVMKKWQEFAGEPTDRDTRVKKTKTIMQVDSAAYYDTQSKDLVQNATLVNDKIAAFIDDGGLVHESIHRGLAMIRDLRGKGLQLSSEADQWLDNQNTYNTPTAQASVDHCMIRSIMHGDGEIHCEEFYRMDKQAQEFFNRKWRSSFNDRYVDLAPGSAEPRFNKQGEVVLGKDREPEEPITDLAEQISFYFVLLYKDIARAVGKFLKTPRFTSPGRPKLRPSSAAAITGTTIKGNPSVEQWLKSVQSLIDRGTITDNEQTRAQLIKDVETLASRHAEPTHYEYLLDAPRIVDNIFNGNVTYYSIVGKFKDREKPQQGQTGNLELYIRSVRDDLQQGSSVDRDTVERTIEQLLQQPVSSQRLQVFTDQLLANGSGFTNQMIRKGIVYLLAQ